MVEGRRRLLEKLKAEGKPVPWGRKRGGVNRSAAERPSLGELPSNTPERDATWKNFSPRSFGGSDVKFWGFDTQEEWDACMEKMSQKAEEEFHIDLLKYLRGEPNDITPGTIGMCKAEIAKTLVEKDPPLRSLSLFTDREHAVTVTLSPQEMALVRMLSTHEDDLPRA
jgi:hypothetical protein